MYVYLVEKVESFDNNEESVLITYDAEYYCHDLGV
jgi:hypothetical protein